MKNKNPQHLTANSLTSKCRLDLWLVAARFYKTRALAVSAIENNRVLVNGQKAKPSRELKLEDILIIKKNSFLIFEVMVKELAIKRVSAKIAQTYYLESEESIKNREKLQREFKLAQNLVVFSQEKPEKKERKNLIAIKRGDF